MNLLYQTPLMKLENLYSFWHASCTFGDDWVLSLCSSGTSQSVCCNVHFSCDWQTSSQWDTWYQTESSVMQSRFYRCAAPCQGYLSSRQLVHTLGKPPQSPCQACGPPWGVLLSLLPSSGSRGRESYTASYPLALEPAVGGGRRQKWPLVYLPSYSQNLFP